MEDNNVNIKELVLGFSDVFYNISFGQLYLNEDRRIIRNIMINSFSLVMKEILPLKYFVRCESENYELECELYIFDEKKERDNWINKHKDERDCQKITFEEFDEFSCGKWRDWQSYSARRFDCESVTPGTIKIDKNPLKLEIYPIFSKICAYEENDD